MCPDSFLSGCHLYHLSLFPRFLLQYLPTLFRTFWLQYSRRSFSVLLRRLTAKRLPVLRWFVLTYFLPSRPLFLLRRSLLLSPFPDLFRYFVLFIVSRTHYSLDH